MHRPRSVLVQLLRMSVLALSCATGCTAARLSGPSPTYTADPGTPRVVVLEPFFESAQWRTSTKSEQVQVYGGYGSYAAVPQTVTVTRQIAEKPIYARPESLAREHQEVLSAVQRLRPSWRVTSTGGLSAVTGPVNLVRVVVGEVDVVGSDRTLKTLSFAFGFVLPPLFLLNTQPVQETHRVYGQLSRYEGDARTFAERRLKYPTQPDFAIDTRGLTPLSRAFGLDVDFVEGVLASEESRGSTLQSGFAQRLAVAVVALVEEQG